LVDHGSGDVNSCCVVLGCVTCSNERKSYLGEEERKRGIEGERSDSEKSEKKRKK
jgi:hypothetical protein